MKVLETTAALAMRKVTRSAGIGSANRSALDIGVFMKVASICWDSWTARRDGLTVVAVVVSAGCWIVKVILERRVRRRDFQTKNGVQQRDGW